LGVIGVPAPGGAAALLPLIALPGGDAEILALVGRIVGVHVAGEQDFAVRAGGVPGPHVLAGVGIERRDAATDAELTTRDAGDDDVLDHDRGHGDGRAILVGHRLDLRGGPLGVTDLPQ